MARPLRIEYPGAIYHVTSRGNVRKAIYRDDEDRELFLACLGEQWLRDDDSPGVTDLSDGYVRSFHSGNNAIP